MNLKTVAIFSLNSCSSVMLIAVNKVLLSRQGFVWGMSYCTAASRASCSCAVWLTGLAARLRLFIQPSRCVAYILAQRLQ
jgi:hypothetical protein